MNDESWRHLLLLEVKGDLTRVTTNQTFDAVRTWAHDNWDVTYWASDVLTYEFADVPNRVLYYQCPAGESSIRKAEVNKRRGEGTKEIDVKIIDTLSKAIMIYAALSDKKDDRVGLVWFRRREAAMLFKLSTGDK